MARQLRQVLFVLILLSMLLTPTAARPRLIADAQDGGPQLIQTSASSLTFALDVPSPKVEQIEAGGRQFQRLSLPDYTPFGKPGQPELLQTGVVIGVPATGDVTIRVLDAQSEVLTGAFTLVPRPDRVIGYDQAGRPDPEQGVIEQFVWDAAAYAEDAFLPADVVLLEEIGFVRQQRVARITIRPVQYNPASGVVKVYRRLQVEVDFAAPAEASQLQAPQTADVFDAVLQSQLLNADQARAWRAPRLPSAAETLAAPAIYPGDTSRAWFKTSLRASGLYKLTLDDLQQSDLAPLATANPANLEVWKNGQQLPAHFIGDGDAVFEPGEALVFYADVQTTIYSATDVFWFAVGNGPALRMATSDASPAGVAPETTLPATLHLEEDLVFRHDLPPIGDPDYPRWYWTDLHSWFNPSRTLYAALPNAASAGPNATLRVRLYGNTAAQASPDHHVRVTVNGQLVGESTWDGKTAVIGQYQFPASVLVAGLNTIVLTAPGDLPGASLDQSYIDWIDLAYPQAPRAVNNRTAFSITANGRREFAVRGFTGPNVFAYDVTDPAAPMRLTGVQINPGNAEVEQASAPPLASEQTRRVFLPTMGGTAQTATGAYTLRFGRNLAGSQSIAAARLGSINRVGPVTRDTGSNLRSTNNQADYLLVTHSDFAAAAQTLANHRRSTGLTVAQIDVQDIYDEFSNGRLDPRAIRSFVDYAYHNWRSPAPVYLLLLGDGHYDYRLTTGLTSQPEFIPPYYDCVDPWVCEVAVDNEFVTVSGADRLPDLEVGRLPASNAIDATTMVNKIIRYETAPPAGAWRSTVAFVADNYRAADGTPDPAGNFEALSESAIALLTPQYTANRIFYDPYPNDDAGEPFRYRTPEAATQAIINAVTAGRLFVNYIGHASNTTWAAETLLRARDTGRNDIASMLNGSKLAIFLDMACLSGNFADVEFVGIEAKLLEWSQGGSVAGWGATGFGVATGHDKLHQGFYRAIFTDHVRVLGQATFAGKLNLWRTGHDFDLLDTFGLLGDPALRLTLMPTD